MRFKKLVSAAAALALSATAFAGLGTQALAAETLLTIDFTDKSLTATSTGNYTTFSVMNASSAGTTALASDSDNMVLKLGGSSSGEKNYLSYTSDLGETYTGAINLSYKIEPMQILTTGDSQVDVQFADSSYTPVFCVSAGTRGTQSIKISNGTTGTYTLGYYYVVSADLNYYNKTITATVKSSDGTETLSTYSGDLTATDLRYLYLADTGWRYGYAALDDITVATMDGAETTFTVTNLSGGVVADASITIGNVTLTTDSDGTATVNLPVGTYSYSVEKDGCATTDASSGSFSVESTDTPVSVKPTLDTEATLYTVAVNYYVKDSGNVEVPVPEEAVTKLEKAEGYDVTSADVYTTTIENTDAKYVYDSIDTYKVTTDENQSVNVYFTKYDAVTSLTVNLKDSNGDTVDSQKTTQFLNTTNAAVITDPVYVGDTVGYGVPKYIVKDGTLYITEPTESDSSMGIYYSTRTLESAEDTVDADNFTYTVVGKGTYQFADFNGGYNPYQTSSRRTNAMSGASATQIGATGTGLELLTVEEAGYYDIEAHVVSYTTSSRSVYLSTESAVTADNAILSVSDVDYSKYTPITGTIALSAGDKIYAAGNNGSDLYIDYILITKADPTISATYSTVPLTKSELTDLAPVSEDADVNDLDSTFNVTSFAIAVTNYDEDELGNPELSIDGVTTALEASDTSNSLKYFYLNDEGTAFFLYQVIGDVTPTGISIKDGTYTGTVTAEATE